MNGPQWIDVFNTTVAVVVIGAMLAFALAAFNIKRR